MGGHRYPSGSEGDNGKVWKEKVGPRMRIGKGGRKKKMEGWGYMVRVIGCKDGR